jgi:hypothetical protein
MASIIIHIDTEREEDVRDLAEAVEKVARLVTFQTVVRSSIATDQDLVDAAFDKRLDDVIDYVNALTEITGDAKFVPEKYVPEPEYILCAGHNEDGKPCPLFVEVNDDHEDDPDNIAPWIHLSRGDDADEAWEDHEAVPGESHTLDWWKSSGPERVRERFID